MGYTELKFQKFSNLLADVESDLRIYSEEGQIEPGVLIKIAQRVNYDLGLRIHQTKEAIIDIDNHVAKLPEDFYVLDFALLLGKCKQIVPQNWGGRVTENIDTGVACSGSCSCLLPLTDDTIYLNPNKSYSICNSSPNTCTPEWDPWFQRSCYSVCDGGGCVKVIEKNRAEIKEYEYFEKLYIKPQRYLDPGSVNSKFVPGVCASGEIKNGFIYTNVPHGRIYISYQGSLQDEEGDLLVLSHPEIDLYYQAALKERIFENLYLSGEEVKEKLQYLKQECKEARMRALNIVNMPNFQELQGMWMLNRRAQRNRFYSAFQTGVFNSWYPARPPYPTRY